jgi:hypothetical protein
LRSLAPVLDLPDVQRSNEMTHQPIATAQMLIRRPIAVVFEAFVDPAITARFWFSRGSDRLEAGTRVRWDWDMSGAGTIEPNLVIDHAGCRRLKQVAGEMKTAQHWRSRGQSCDRPICGRSMEATA